jgi:hypothetical protein
MNTTTTKGFYILSFKKTNEELKISEGNNKPTSSEI